MTITKHASAHWEGGLKDGKGTISMESGALKDQPYGFNTRFEDKAGTNPEELIAAAHSSCFSMALSMILGQEDITADAIDTKADVHLDKQDDGFSVTKIDLHSTIKAAGADEDTIKKCAETAKENCPISKLFKAEITLDLAIET